MAHMYWVILASLFVSAVPLKSTKGREFVTGFLSLSPQCTLKLDIASNTNGDVELYVPYLGINTTYSFNRTFSTTFNTSLQLYGTRIGRNGVYIKSSVDISVYASTYMYQPRGNAEDTHVCLPVQSLGREYYIASYIPYQVFGDPSLFMVISAFANTKVNISFPNGTSISKTLNWLDVYQEASPSNDLTGTIVQSSKPVSVVSGTSCAYVFKSSECDMLGEQMIPTNSFQTHFIIPPILSNQFMVRIFSSQSNNKVCVKDSSFEYCSIMDANQWLESVPNNSSLVVSSQKPISVIQYNGNPAYMAIIPGIRQFMNSYTFVVPDDTMINTHYISVTILSSASLTLRLDEKSPGDQLVDTAYVNTPFNNYTILTFGIKAGYHVMTSTETHAVFGLIVFGMWAFGAYGFPAGINLDIDECASNPCLYGSTCSNGVNSYTCTCRGGLSGRNCEIDVNECASSPCLHGGTCSDGVNVYTCTCSAGFSGRNCESNINECASSPCLHGGTCSDGVNAYTCSCSAGFSGSNCDLNINECASSPCLHGGTCSDGVNAYTCSCSAGFIGSNCGTDINECASSPCLHGGTCSDGVNSYTCTCSSGFSGRNCGIISDSNKQLVCYSCEGMSHLELCDSVKRCGNGEVCVVERTHITYRSGCANSSICSTYYPSSSHCAECCNNDYCNGRGCGDEGLVSRHERGPLCYDCNHVRTIHECTAIRPCNKHQSCSVEEYEWLDHTHFKLGCVDLPCSAIGDGFLGSLPRCKSCCDQDFCNTNCTLHQTVAIIG
ncbi:IgGFc-binding protein-like [Dreissena polymorpha]|uniref:IgGFc-binding protein-like n=1 Tax=Dreissena polymorpha TaxID=45954 RepID=UPI0022647982|nr:IgGFc-binding protein-like [Dreissena polymorpha]